MTINYRTLKLDINDNIAIISLCRPESRNAYNDKMAIELLRAFEQADQNNKVRAILLRAEGKIFSVGGDIKMFASKLEQMPADIPDIIEVLNATILTIVNSNKIVLASVHGAVAGVGMSFMLACDLAIAADNTQFTLAYADLGLTPDGGASYILPKIVGQKKAMQMLLLPELFTAQQAFDLSLINWVVSENELDKKTSTLMYKLANGPYIAYKRAKVLLNQSWYKQIDDQLTEEMHAFTECTTTQDFHRGVEGFINKAKPVFEGN